MKLPKLCEAYCRVSGGQHTMVALVFAGLMASWTGLGADPLVLNIVHVDVKSTEIEAVDVPEDGSFVLGGAPILMPELGNEAEAFHSELPRLVHDPEQEMPFWELPRIRLGPGELTDIAIGPDRAFVVVCIRDDELHERNQLMLLNDQAATFRLNLPDSADGIGLSPDGRYVVVAGEKYEAVDVYEVVHPTEGKAPQLELAARIGREAFDPFFAGEEARLATEDLEPESVAFNPDGSLAFVTLQEQSSVAVIDMGTMTLVNVVHLPYGFLVDMAEEGEEPDYATFGVESDGLSVTLDGQFLIVANEASGDAPHLGGVSVVDLRQGPTNIPEPKTYCVFDLDPTLLAGTGLDSCPMLAPGVAPTPEETAAIRSLPRLDPNNTKCVVRGGRVITAVNIERKPKAGGDRGSVLFLDLTEMADGGNPVKVERIPVGIHKNARPEGLRTSNHGRFIWVGLQIDGGTIARIELAD